MKKIRDRKEIKKLKKKEINMNMYLGKILRRQLDNANPKVKKHTSTHTRKYNNGQNTDWKQRKELKKKNE